MLFIFKLPTKYIIFSSKFLKFRVLSYIYIKLIVWEGGKPWSKTGATYYNVQLGLLEKGCLQWLGYTLDLLSSGLSPEV